MHKKLGRNTVVLLGVGHTNAHVLRMWKMKPLDNAQLVCVSNFPQATYSGMMPGVLAGQYDPSAMQIDLVRLCASAGARLIIDEVIGIDHEQRELIFRNRPKLCFDVLSIGIGSRPTFAGVELAADNALVAVKPMQTFLDRFRKKMLDVSSQRNSSGGEKVKVAIVGGGIGSIEIAVCLDERLKKNPASLGLEAPGADVEITLVTGGKRVGHGLLDSTQGKIEAQFQRRGIKTSLGSRVQNVESDHLNLKNGNRVDADIAIWATSAVAPELLGKLDLETDEKGFVSTRPTLQSVTNDRVFAVGDSGTIVGSGLVKAGVYAVRQGPVLWDNIRRLIWSRKLVDYVPQKGFLKLINTADGKAIAEYRGRSFYGGWCWRLKNRIDVKFMKMYQDYTMMEMVPEKPNADDVMRCLGCGGKIGSQLLSQVLDELEVPPHEDVVIGLENPDDAAVVKTHGGSVTVTTDFFASPMDDPYLVGRIAMLNSASDCCVMGAQPTTALAIVQLPLGHPRAQLQVMRELMAGSIDELKKMNATIVGGHSIEGPRMTIGFTILGRQLTDPKTKGMLQVGDRLVLTKPIGTGVLLAALMQGKLAGTAYQPLVDAMLQSNYIALRLIQEHHVSGITDVTGFGLAGHLAEMLRASGKSAEIKMADVAVLPECQTLIEAGIESTLAPDNRHVAEKVNLEGDVDSLRIASLFDPQTSGGLLFGISESRTESVLKFLADEGFGDSVVIGEVIQKTDDLETLRIV
ncbi:MAG: selenide, water dikinase SelD [Mariniblastus sp.]